MSEFDRFPLLYESYGRRFAESQVVTVAVATGIFAYTKLESCDSAGTPKSSFLAGDTVYANIKGKNNGVVADGAVIVVTDNDTGTELTRLGSTVVNPGAEFTMSKVLIGTMPKRDWNIKFAMTP